MSPQEGGATSFLAQHLLSFSPHPIPGSRKQRGERAPWEELTPRSVEQIPEGMKLWDYANPG